MYKTPDILEKVAVLIPVYFKPGEDPKLIRGILEDTFRHQASICRSENLLAVVDRNSAAERIFREAGEQSPLYGVKIHILRENRCKAGAVREGLENLLSRTDAEYFATRDCDGDHFIEDLPRLVHFLLYASDLTGNQTVCVMGSRASLEKPMGWIRQEWENLTNDFLTSAIAFRLAENLGVIDQRFWNGNPPDIQSGYRLYSRRAARIAADSLGALPEDRHILKFACEFEPFVDISLQGGFFCQVNRLTLVEQPVSSFSDSNYALDYGSYLKYLVNKLDINLDTALLLFDNALSKRSLFFTDHRRELLECRSLLEDEPSIPLQAPFV